MPTEADFNSDHSGGEFLTRLKILPKIFKASSKAEVISIIVGRYAKLGLFEYAIELAETISDPLTRDNTLFPPSVVSRDQDRQRYGRRNNAVRFQLRAVAIIISPPILLTYFWYAALKCRM